jgi:hypothetical protein
MAERSWARPGIADIAVIARHRRNRKSKTVNRKGREGTQRKTAEIHANLGSAGMTQVKHFRILVEAEGRGAAQSAAIADIAEIARHRRNRKSGTDWDGLGW